LEYLILGCQGHILEGLQKETRSIRDIYKSLTFGCITAKPFDIIIRKPKGTIIIKYLFFKVQF
jgi:hypothetical protein